MTELVSLRNLEFLIWEWLGLEAMLDRPRFDDLDATQVRSTIELAHRVAMREIAPHARLADTIEPWLDAAGSVHVPPESAQAVRAMARAGFFATAFDHDRGGLQLPQLVHVTAMGLMMAGNMGIASYLLLTTGNARLIAAYGNAAQVALFADPQIAGETMGTMCLSEPHAGSSLAEIRTRAQPDGEDELGFRYRVTGNKMWISGGDQDVTENIVHLVLAKVPGADGRPIPGVKGISLLIVPKILPDGTPNDVAVVGLNHKLGQRALPNCALNFGEGKHQPGGKPGAVGWLVGSLGQGLAQMFQMMNDARVAVGLSGAMLALRGYQLSLAYAQERVQGKPVNGAEQIAIIGHADVKRMLLSQKSLAEGALALVLYAARLLDDEATANDPATRDEAALLLGLLTPIVKSWPSEFGQESLHQGLQIFGGVGYTRDAQIELVYRDNRLNPIHEGTTGIHGLDLVARKLRRDGGAALALLDERIERSFARAAGVSQLETATHALRSSYQHLADTVSRLLAEPDDARAIANATPFLYAFGHVVVGWLWLEQATLAEAKLFAGADGQERHFYAGKTRAFAYFAEAELPRVTGWLSQVNAMSDVAASMAIQEF